VPRGVREPQDDVRRRLTEGPSLMQPREPSPQRRMSSKRAWGLVAVFLAVVAAITLSLTVPIPIYYAQLPGPIRDVERLVDVEGRTTFSSEGELYMTTVSFDTRVTFVEWINATLDPTKKVVERDQVTGGLSLEELERIQVEEMKNSQSAAQVVAATALGSSPPTGDGARIVSVVQEPAKGELRPGDVIVGIDGSAVATICDVYRLLRDRAPGDEIEIEVERDSEVMSFTLQAGSTTVDPGQAFLGIAMTSDYEFSPGFEVEFDTGRVAGPSAGLMLSLGLYDQLTPEDLTKGRAIAGTGTITCDGSVGPIGGIEQKIAAAEAAGVDAFLAPAANADAARSAANDIAIVAVDTFADAVEFLQSR
jgi:PDZ domain-containing protein